MRAITPIIAGGLLVATLAAAMSSRKRVTVKGYKTTAQAHANARQLAIEAFEDVVHAQPKTNELRMLLAVALHESTFGAGWRGNGEGSNNMGALQAGSGWTGETFATKDTHPTSTGGSIAYEGQFRKYSSPLEGWQDLVRVLYIQSPATRVAAATGDPRAVAKAMRRAGYYEGQGPTQDARIGAYEQALVNALWEIDHFGSTK